MFDACSKWDHVKGDVEGLLFFVVYQWVRWFILSCLLLTRLRILGRVYIGGLLLVVA